MRLDRSLSAYLDLLRFVAALAVLLGHMEQDGLYMSWMPLFAFSHEAVIIFFVMSGFIIYTSTLNSGRHWGDYAVARVSRVYSVALPAVIFSLFLSLTVAYASSPTEAQLSNFRPFSLWDVSSSLLFLNEAFGNKAGLSLNGPYWSLCYEVWYYVIFGVFLFVRNNQRAFWLAAAAIVAGPAVLALFPIWIMGALLAAKWEKFPAITQRVAWAIFLGSIAVIILINASGVGTLIRVYLHDHVPGFWRLGSSQKLLTDYVTGIAVVLHIVAFSSLNAGFKAFFLRFEKIFKYLAGFSFTLYLFHRPLTQLAGYYMPNTEASIVRSLFVLFAILLMCVIISYGTERRLGFWRAFLAKRFGLAAGSRVV
ncbi:MAG: acyltransferase [Azonexus sp.]|nr:acyltransferase [Azonexus sp.]